MSSIIDNEEHPLINFGTHIILDIFDIENNEKLKYKNDIIYILDSIIKEFNLNVVEKAIYQFQPFGVTGVYVLSESHLSIHTFVNEKKVAIDLYTCINFTRIQEFVEFVKNHFGECNYNFTTVNR